ncbi:hypothetical protein BDZ89DRAFT_1162799 [Hymenopellis radicata]|nr:hypothetical protein BDZ89DRAFT_1162799 [Hymenopellis radicata]
MAIDLGVIAGGIFYHCPPNLPLSIHCFSLITAVHRHVINLFYSNYTVDSSPSQSLRDVELETVERQALVIDASALGWLFNQTCNYLPLQSVPIIIKTGADTVPSDVVLKAIDDHFLPDQPLDRFERFQRTALRFQKEETEDSVVAACKEVSKYTSFRDSSAHRLIKANLLGCPEAQTMFDNVLWGKIFSNALLGGTDWLEIDHDEPSRAWSELLREAVRLHECDKCNCDGKQQPLYTFRSPAPMPSLSIYDYDIATNGRSNRMGFVLANNMRPSFVKWLLHVAFPNATLLRVDDPNTSYEKSLPDDITLVLKMIQTPSIQKTKTWVGDNANDPSLFHHLLCTVGGWTANRERDDFPCFRYQDNNTLARGFFEGLNRRRHCTGSQDDEFSWLTSEVLSVAFADPRDATILVSHILSYVLCSSMLLPALELVYKGLLERRWLQGITTSLKSGSTWHSPSCPKEPLYLWKVHHTGFLAIYNRVLADLKEPDNLTTTCKVLLLSDVSVQSKLWILAKIVHWDQCLQELTAFSETQQGSEDSLYSLHLAFPKVGLEWSTTMFDFLGSTGAIHLDQCQNDIWLNAGIPHTPVAGDIRLVVQILNPPNGVLYAERFHAVAGWVVTIMPAPLVLVDHATNIPVPRIIIPIAALANPFVPPGLPAATTGFQFDWNRDVSLSGMPIFYIAHRSRRAGQQYLQARNPSPPARLYHVITWRTQTSHWRGGFS